MESLPPIERYIAIDNVCAWPNLTLFPDGSLTAVIFNQPCHGLWEGDVDCWASTDGGRSWKFRGTPARHEPKTNRMNVAVGLAANGDMVVLASGLGGEGFREYILPCWICRSKDQGITWEKSGSIVTPAGSAHPVPYGDVIILPDGCLGVTAYCRGEQGLAAYFFRSDDDGYSWKNPVLIAKGISETDLLLLPGGSLLAAARRHGEHCLDLYRSSDGGDTWTLQEQVTGAAHHPGHLLLMNDGQILLSYGIRHRGFYGIGVRLSDDEGKTWYPPGVLADLNESWDGGYPSTEQLEDGTLVTAYYANNTTDHSRYHVGVVRWQIPHVFGRNSAPLEIAKKM